MLDNFFNKLSKGITLTEADKAIFREHVSVKRLRKHQYLLQEGEICKSVAFVSKGMLRSYLVDEKNNEQIIQFAPEGWFISDLSSFITEDISSLNIEAIEDSELILISKAAHVYLETAVPGFYKFNYTAVPRCLYVAAEKINRHVHVINRRKIHQTFKYLSGYYAARTTTYDRFLSRVNTGNTKPCQKETLCKKETKALIEINIIS